MIFTKQNLKYFQNREISHLEFHKRVLLESENKEIPLFERIKFLQIFYNNIDEFFMTRVSSLYYDKILNKQKLDILTNLNIKEQLDLISNKTQKLFKLSDKIYFDLMTESSESYLEHININQLEYNEYKYLENFFDANIFPLISPQIIDKHHPFPFLKNKEIYIYVKLISKKKDTIKIGIIPAVGYFNRIIMIPNNFNNNNFNNNNFKKKFVLVEDLILHFAYKIFNKYKIISKTKFKITRKMELEPELNEKIKDDCSDMKQVMSILLKQRRNLSPVKLEINKCEDARDVINYLSKKLNLEEKQVFVLKAPLDLSFLSVLIKMFDMYEFPNLFYKKILPKKPENISNISMIDQVLKKDILLSYPFDSMVLFYKLLDQAAEDEKVVSIKITLYRVAHSSQVVSILKKAADNGKDVLVIVELKAKFDEQNNIEWATALEESGCKVIYGLENYKIHAKVLLITRKDDQNINYISQIGTGNYNEVTAKSYTDLCFMTCDEKIGKDILNLFNNICVGTVQENTVKILSSPVIFKPSFLDLISEEITKALSGQPAEIIIKCNSLSDKDIIFKLIDASKAGVKIKLIIRGICCLIPGIEDLTENIEVISIIGRFLEHSRVFCFGSSYQDKKIFISSADLMTRNTEKRVEVVCPIEDPEIKSKIIKLLDFYLKDNVLAQKLDVDGEYKKLNSSSPDNIFNCQEKLFNL